MHTSRKHSWENKSRTLVRKSKRWENGAAISSGRNKTRTEISATRIVSSRRGRESTPRTPGSKPTSWRARPGRRKIRTRRRKRRTPQQQLARKLESLGSQVLRPMSTERTRLRIKQRAKSFMNSKTGCPLQIWTARTKS
jgi:hypothetical protein